MVVSAEYKQQKVNDEKTYLCDPSAEIPPC
jgi:hypothetical protein